MATTTTEDRLLSDVLRTFQNTPNPRLHQIVEALVRHLHAFANEVNLTHEEWFEGIKFLTAVGKFNDDSRNEFILLSDVCGLSSLVETIGYGGGETATEQTVLGPFYIEGSPAHKNGDSVIEYDDGGTPLHVSGTVRSTDGTPLAGAKVDIWQTATMGFYPVQDPNQPATNLRGVFTTDADGHYDFITVRPVPYPVPTDGPAGAFLKATARHPMRAAHVHLIVSKDGYVPVTTHIFDAESDYLDSDAVFGVRDSLVRTFDKEPDGTLSVDFDVALSPKQ